MDLVLPYNIINNTPADAVPVEANYDVIAGFVNAQVINRDGSVAMDAPLLLKSDPTSENHAANKSYVDALLPIGIIMPFGGVAAPAGQWLKCDGSDKSTSTYRTLFDVLGYRYGGSGATFKVPNMNGRVPVGVDPTRTAFNATGKSGGAFAVPVTQHSHTMPHSHTVPVHTHEHPHTHKIDHNHGSFPTVSAAAHLHNGKYKTIFHDGVAQTNVFVASNETVGVSTSNLQGGLGADGAHAHTVDVPNFAGTSAAVSEATTAANVAASTGASSAPSTANAGVAAPELIPPYVIVTYIIRAA
jgi:microcystin-dependent protein